MSELSRLILLERVLGTMTGNLELPCLSVSVQHKTRSLIIEALSCLNNYVLICTHWYMYTHFRECKISTLPSSDSPLTICLYLPWTKGAAFGQVVWWSSYMANRALQFMIHSRFIKTCMFLKVNVNRIRNVKVSFYLMCFLFFMHPFYYSDCPGSPASISCLTASLASLYVLPVNKKQGWWQKLLFCMGNWSLHDADQSLVSCKLVISSKCI